MARHGRRRGAPVRRPTDTTPDLVELLGKDLLNELRSIPDPPYVPPTAEELERRSRAFDEILRLREEIGPIDVSVVDLIRQDRGWPGEEPQADG